MSAASEAPTAGSASSEGSSPQTQTASQGECGSYDEKPTGALRIGSYNVASIRTVVDHLNHHYGGIAKWLDSKQVDIMCFQEVKLTDSNLDKSLALPEGYETFWALSNKRKGYSGVATFVKEGKYSPVAAEKHIFKETSLNEEGRCMVTNHGEFVVLNVYVPNAGEYPERERLPYKLRFLHKLRSYMNSYQDKGYHVLLAGDLNIAHLEQDVSERIRRENPLFHGYSKEELQWLRDLVGYDDNTSFPITDPSLSSSGNLLVDCTPGRYVDTFRVQNRFSQDCFTCWDQRKNHRVINDGVRIDYIITDKEFFRKHVIDKTARIHNTSSRWSDHVMVSLDFWAPPAPPSHRPCQLSSKVDPRFKPQGQSIFKFFSAAQKRKSGDHHVCHQHHKEEPQEQTFAKAQRKS